MFLLFAGSNYYPQGGVDDYVMSGSREALSEALRLRCDMIFDGVDLVCGGWAQIVDAETMKLEDLYGVTKVDSGEYVLILKSTGVPVDGKAIQPN